MLGLDAGTTDPKQLKEAFRLRAKAVHPDLNPDKPIQESKEEFLRVFQAFEAMMETQPTRGGGSTVAWDRTTPPPWKQEQGQQEDDGFSEEDVFRRRRSERSTRKRQQARRSNRQNNDLMKHRADALSFVDLSWWTNLESELGDALDFAFWGPHFEGAEDQWPFEFEGEERNLEGSVSDAQQLEEEAAHPHILALVSGRQELGYVQVDSAARISDGFEYGRRAALGDGDFDGDPERTWADARSARSSDGAQPPLPPPLELLYQGRRIATALCVLGTALERSGGKGSSSSSASSSSLGEQPEFRGRPGKNGLRVMEVYGFPGCAGGVGGENHRGAQLLASVEGPYDEFSGASRYRVFNGSGSLHGQVLIIQTPGVETCSWLVSSHHPHPHPHPQRGANGGRSKFSENNKDEQEEEDAQDAQGGATAGRESRSREHGGGQRAQQMYGKTSGRPLIECKTTRAWLPPQKLWLWEPRAVSHKGSAVYFEIARDKSTRRGWVDNSDEFGSDTHAINLSDFFPCNSAAAAAPRDPEEAVAPHHARLHPAVFVMFSAYRTLAREERAAAEKKKKKKKKRRGHSPLSGWWDGSQK